MLMVAMMAIAVMTIQGSVALTASLNSITTSINTRVLDDTTAIAQAGIEEAKARFASIQVANLDYVGNPAALPANLSFYFLTSKVLTTNSWTFAKDTDYIATLTNYIPTATSGWSLINTTLTANSAQSALPYWAKVRHKVELDAENAGHRTTSPHYIDGDGLTLLHNALNRGNVIYYGYRTATDSTPVQFTTAALTNAAPVELVRSYGMNGNTTKGIEVEMARDIGPPVYSAMYSDGNVNFSKPGYVSGIDACGIGPNRPPVYYQDPRTLSGSTTYDGSPATPQHGGLDVNRSETIDAMKGGATVITADQNGATFGSSTTYVTVYADTSSPYNANGLQLKDTVGYGTLLVKGDLVLGKNVTWNGLIITTGQVTLKAPDDDDTATLNVRGSILSDGIYAQKSGYDIRYNSCQIAKALGNRPLKIIRWRKLS